MDHDGSFAVNPDDVVERGLDDLPVHGAVGPVPAGGPHLSEQDGDEEGSSSCSTTWAPGKRRLTSARCWRSPSASEAARSRQAPASERAASPFLSSRAAASVQGPTAWTFSGPSYPWVNSSSASRSSPSHDRARLVSRPGRSPSRHPLGSTRAYSSTSIPAVRPIMSAPGPRAGSSARNGKSSKDPVTVLAASRASPPGIEPTPVAAPKLNWVLLSLTPEAYVTLRGTVPGPAPWKSRQFPGRTVRSLTSASLGRSRAIRIVVATDSGSIHFDSSYALPSCWWTFACMGLAVRPG